VLSDLPRYIEKQSVIDVESLAGKRNEAGDYGGRQENVRIKVLSMVLESLRRRNHGAV